MPKPNKNQTENHGEILFFWEFPEYEKHERSKKWYFLATLIAMGLLIFSLTTFNFLFAVIIMMAAIIIFIHHGRQPEKIFFRITEDGLEVGENFYAYKELKIFWLIYEPPDVKNLYFDFKGFFRPTLVIPLTNKNPLKIRETLVKYLEEDLEKENEPFSDSLGRVLKL